jgi:SAM-dependent methyltransferase
MMIPASTPANTPLTEAKIPTFIESAFISSKLTSTPGEKLHGYSFSKPFGFHQTIGTVVASTEEWEEPLVIIEGCRNTALTTMTEGIADNSTAATSLRKLAEKPTWNVDMKHLSSVTATDVFKRAMQTIPDADSTIVQELELAAFIYCKRVLKEFSADQATSFSPHHQLFYEYIQHQYDRAVKGELNCQQSDQDWINTTKSFEADLIRRVAEDSVDGQLLVRQGNVFSGILKGEIEPLQVLREDNLLTDYYRTAVGTDKLNPVIAEYINLSAHTNPGMKILEVGAGTGATTKVVLEALGGKGNDGSIARMQSYTFTDISTGFFESAMEDFKEWGAFMDYKVLNIEVHPERQGLELESYDMVVASNVLHATTSIATCLANCKRLLKPYVTAMCTLDGS